MQCEGTAGSSDADTEIALSFCPLALMGRRSPQVAHSWANIVFKLKMSFSRDFSAIDGPAVCEAFTKLHARFRLSVKS